MTVYVLFVSYFVDSDIRADEVVDVVATEAVAKKWAAVSEDRSYKAFVVQETKKPCSYKAFVVQETKKP